MVTYTPWVDYGPLWQSDGHTTTAPAIRYESTVDGRGDMTGAQVARTISPSLAAHSSGYEPPDDLDARRCAQAWAAAGIGGTHSEWDPGECPTISGDPPLLGPGGPDIFIFNQFSIGTNAHWAITAPFFIHPFTVSLLHVAVGWWITPDIDSLYLGVSRDALVQVDRWVSAVTTSPDHDFSTDPQVERTRIDVRARLVCTDPQTELVHPFTVSGHPRDRPVTGVTHVTPYQSLSGEAFSAATSPGASSAELTWTDVTPGDAQYYDLASSRVLAGEDPGTTPFQQSEVNFAHMRWVVDIGWSFRIRYPIFEEPPLRWRQRNDGRGVGAAHRHKTGTSIQASHRHRGGYR